MMSIIHVMHDIDENVQKLQIVDFIQNMFVYVESSNCLPFLGLVRYRKRSPEILVSTPAR